MAVNRTPSDRHASVFLPGQQPIEMTGDEVLPVPDFLQINL
ncbi:MAG: hypothetical protein V7L11_13970 [Nostoc sp.]